MKTVAKPRKPFISYTWRPKLDEELIELELAHGLRTRRPKPEEEWLGVKQGLELADRLRKTGLDSRIDQYFLRSDPGFVPPNSRQGDRVPDPWVMWAEEQIRDADFVLLVCGAPYTVLTWASPLGGELTWKEWHSLPDDSKIKLHKLQMDESPGEKKISCHPCGGTGTS